MCAARSNHTGIVHAIAQQAFSRRTKLWKRAAVLLKESANIAVLTGAGVSAESGLATFRGPDGLWEGQRVEDVATPFAFHRNPELVWRFYNARRATYAPLVRTPAILRWRRWKKECRTAASL